MFEWHIFFIWFFSVPQKYSVFSSFSSKKRKILISDKKYCLQSIYLLEKYLLFTPCPPSQINSCPFDWLQSFDILLLILRNIYFYHKICSLFVETRLLLNYFVSKKMVFCLRFCAVLHLFCNFVEIWRYSAPEGEGNGNSKLCRRVWCEPVLNQ